MGGMGVASGGHKGRQGAVGCDFDAGSAVSEIKRIDP